MASAKPRSNITIADDIHDTETFMNGQRRSATLPTGGSTYRSGDQANDARPPIMPAIVTMTIGSWNGTASSDNFPNIFILPSTPLMGGFRVAHVHAFHTFMCAVLTFWLHVHALTVSHKLVNRQTSLVSRWRNIPLVVFARRGQFSNAAMSDMLFGDCFAFATHWSNAARSGVAIALNFMPETGPL